MALIIFDRALESQPVFYAMAKHSSSSDRIYYCTENKNKLSVRKSAAPFGIQLSNQDRKLYEKEKRETKSISLCRRRTSGDERSNCGCNRRKTDRQAYVQRYVRVRSSSFSCLYFVIGSGNFVEKEENNLSNYNVRWSFSGKEVRPV